MLINKYADHCPLHRQSAILKRGGLELDRSTLASWVGKTCWWLQPVYDHLMATMLASGKIFADETKMPVLKPGNGKTKSGFLWGYAVDDRPWVGPSPPLVVYVYADGRLSTKSKLAEAIAYALTRWDGFTLFLDDGRIELDTNVLERAIRPIVLTRKNALFAGSDRGAVHWAMASSIIETCRLNHVEPFAYLKDVLERMVSGRTKANQIDQLMPWNWETVGHG